MVVRRRTGLRRTRATNPGARAAVAAALAAGLLSSGSLHPGTAAAQPGGDAISPARDAAGETLMLARVNAMRNAAGLGILRREPGLDSAALAHSADMAAHDEIAHVSARTGDPASRVSRAGVSARAIAENVALNQSAIAAHEALVASDGHRANLMGEAYTHIGLAIVPGPRGLYVTQVFAQIDEATEIAGDGPAAGAEMAPATGAIVLDAEPEPAPDTGEAGAPAAPVVQVPAGGQRQVIGYWVSHGGRWWFYPRPPDAQPGQVLTHDPRVVGGPGASGQAGAYPLPGWQISAGSPRAYVAPGRVVFVRRPPPAPVFGWSPRRYHRPYYYYAR